MEHDRNVLFQGAVPENYDRYFGPVIFEPWVEDLVARLAGRKYERVIEIACGTGIVTRILRDALPATTEIIATDLNPDMFEFAKRKFRNGENVIWQQADASILPFRDCSFDAGVCQFGVMFFRIKRLPCASVIASSAVAAFFCSTSGIRSRQIHLAKLRTQRSLYSS